MVSKFRSNLPQILAVCIKNIILIAFGMTLGFPTVLIPALQKNPNETSDDDFFLNKSQISWVSSINLIFVPLGCIFSGSFTAYLGRRRAMQLVCVPIIAAWVVFFYSHQVFHLYIALCLGGFAGGMLEAPVLTYVAEISTPNLRGILSATGSFCIILGIFSQFLMGIYFDWKTITLISTSVPIAAIICLFFVPESPYWLIMKKRDEDARKSLMWLRGWLKTADGIKQEFDDLHKTLTMPTSNENEESSWKAFGRRTFILPYFVCTLAFFIGHFSGMTTLQTYAVSIFAQLKAPVDKYFATMLLGIVELVGTGFCVILVRFVGKRKLTFFSLLGCSFCFFSTAIYAFFIREITGEEVVQSSAKLQAENASNSTDLLNFTSTASPVFLQGFSNNTESEIIEIQENELSWIPLTLLLASALLSHSGIRLLPWMLIGEVFPARIRGIASGLTGGTSYIFGFLANKLFLSMVGGLTLPGTFLLYSCVSAVGCILLFFLLPETEGRTLVEIENVFSGKSKFPRSLKRKESVIDLPFPQKFDVNNWESNEKFEKHLEYMKSTQQTNGHQHSQANGQNQVQKPAVEAMKKPTPAKRSTAIASDADYDTPL